MKHRVSLGLYMQIRVNSKIT